MSQQLKGGVCKLHNQNQDFVCLDHKYPICMECSRMELHANHKIRMSAHLVQEQKNKAKQMEDMIKSIEGHQQSLEKQASKQKNVNTNLSDESSRKMLAWKKKY